MRGKEVVIERETKMEKKKKMDEKEQDKKTQTSLTKVIAKREQDPRLLGKRERERKRETDSSEGWHKEQGVKSKEEEGHLRRFKSQA